MATNNIVSGKRINSIFRRSELKFVIIFSLIINIIIALLLNFSFILIANNYTPSSYFLPESYIKMILSNSLFNFVTTSIIAILISTLYSYYLFAEAKLQFKNRKYYLTIDDNFLNIFEFSLSFIFSLLLAVFFCFSLLNFIDQVNPGFDALKFYVPLFFIIFFIPGSIIFFFFYRWQKYMLFNMLSFWNSIASTVKRDLNDQIYNAKINTTNIWLVLIRVSNLAEVSRKYNKNIKFMYKLVTRGLKSIIRTTDFLLSLNPHKGLLGYIVTNDEKSLNELLVRKIKPYLSNKVKMRDEELDLVINYQIIDIVKNDDINNLKDIAGYIKKTAGQ